MHNYLCQLFFLHHRQSKLNIDFVRLSLIRLFEQYIARPVVHEEEHNFVLFLQPFQGRKDLKINKL
jgi:hypothetical protein